MDFRSLVSKFAEGLGVHDLPFDEDGVARLLADDMAISFMEIPERHSMIIWSDVATLPPEHLEELYKTLLEASFMGRGTEGASFSINQGDVYLHRIDALMNLDVATLTKIVESFLNLVATYRQLIDAFRADHAVKEEEGASAENHNHIHHVGVHGFLHI